MSPTPFRPEPADPAPQRDEDAQYYRQILHELIDMGANLARAIHCQATTQPGAASGPEEASQPAPAPDPTIAFDRIARAIRRTIALTRAITEPAPPAATATASERRIAARKRIIREVEDAIQRRADGAEADALNAELGERLDAPDLDDDIAHLPVADIIASICRDLGITVLSGTHPWKRRTPRDVRDLCARAAQPGAADRTRDPRSFPALPPRTRTGTGPPGA
jgi:hypothetical protein